MATLDWIESFKTRFSDRILSVRESAPGEPEIKVKAEAAYEILEALKTLPGGGFDHLADLTAYDEHPATPRHHVVYELISMHRRQRAAVVAVCASNDNPSIRSIVSLWGGAGWLERETFDLCGIHFDGHPDLRRIMLPESFVGHPLKKDFVVDYRQSFPKAAEAEPTFDPFGHTVVRGKE